MRLEAGQYVLDVVGALIKGPLAVEVAIEGDRVASAFAQGTLRSSDPALSVPFEVPPPASDISITLTNEGSDPIALRGIEVRAEGWSYELPLLLT
jgi:hypothetical protein